MKRLLPASFGGWALMLALQAPPALAQPETDPSESARSEASSHFQRGAELFGDGLFRPALVELQRAYEISPNYRVLYNIGQTHVALGEFVEAIHAYEGYLDQGGAEISEERRAELESELPRLRAGTARLLLLVSRAGAVVRVDGRDVGRSPINVPVPVNVGRHEVSASTDDGWSASVDIDLAGGDQEEVALELRPSRRAVERERPSAPRASAEPPGLSQAQRVAVGLFAAAGALALGGGGVALAARSRKKTYEAAIAQVPGDPSEIRSSRSKLLRTSITADALWGTALLTGAVGLVFLLRAPDSTPKEAQRGSGVDVWASFGPTGVVAEGRF